MSYLDNLHNYISFNLFFFNLICFSSGAFILIYNLKSSIHHEKIEDCDNIYLLSFINCLNSLLGLFAFKNQYYISFLSFLGSMFALAYNSFTYHTIKSDCVHYFKTQYNELWIFYNVSLGILAVNVLGHILKMIVCITILNKEEELKYKQENQKLLSYDEENKSYISKDIQKIYENINILFYRLNLITESLDHNKSNNNANVNRNYSVRIGDDSDNENLYDDLN